MLYHVMLFSAVEQSESATCTNIYPLFFRFPYHAGHHGVLSRVPMLCSRFFYLSILYIVVCVCMYIYMSCIYMHICLYVNPDFPTHKTPLSPLFPCLFSMSVSLFMLCKQIHLHHFSRLHMCELIYSTCFSDSLHSV